MDTGRLRSAVTVVVGFFAFVSTLQLVASTFGGGVIGFALSVLVGALVGLTAYLLSPFFASNISQKGKVSAPETKAQRPPSSQRVTFQPACPSGPYDVESGTPVKIPLSVQRADKVVGDVTEVDNSDFDCYIADSANTVKYLNRQRGFRPIFKGVWSGAYSVDVTIPNDTQWYLLLDAPGRKLVREVEVNLKRPSQAEARAT